MQHVGYHWVTIETELRVPTATAHLMHFDPPEPVDTTLLRPDEDEYHLDLSLTPRITNARACYRDRWSSNRFERLGNLFVVPPGESLQARSDAGCQTSIVCHLSPDPIRSLLDNDLEWSPNRLDASLDIRGTNIHSLLLRLADEARHPGFSSHLLVELIAFQLAIELCRYCKAIDKPPATGRLAPWHLRLIEERLRNVREAPTLSELASLCGLSVRQLTRSFRVSTGCSIGEYVARSQIGHARRLLATNQKIETIAYSLGFSSISAFSFSFRRATGESPSQFRKRLSRKG